MKLFSLIKYSSEFCSIECPYIKAQHMNLFCEKFKAKLIDSRRAEQCKKAFKVKKEQ